MGRVDRSPIDKSRWRPSIERQRRPLVEVSAATKPMIINEVVEEGKTDG
jgi:hypothetical protein